MESGSGSRRGLRVLFRDINKATGSKAKAPFLKAKAQWLKWFCEAGGGLT